MNKATLLQRLDPFVQPCGTVAWLLEPARSSPAAPLVDATRAPGVVPLLVFRLGLLSFQGFAQDRETNEDRPLQSQYKWQMRNFSKTTIIAIEIVVRDFLHVDLRTAYLPLPS